MKFNEMLVLLENAAVRSYSCLMLDCSPVAHYVYKLQEEIDPVDVWDEEPGHSYEKEIHVTVKYGIHTTIPTDIIPHLKNLQPCKIKFKKLSLFENDKFDVLKFDIESEDLKRLNKEVSDNFACTDSYPVYHAHSTVCYLKKGTGKKYIKKDCPLIGQSFVFSKFIFSNPLGEKIFIQK